MDGERVWVGELLNRNNLSGEVDRLFGALPLPCLHASLYSSPETFRGASHRGESNNLTNAIR
jgi:hypothetical protein